jgi:hypothetical protein
VRTLHFVVAGFVNNGDSTINVTGVSGGLFDPSNIYAKLFNVTGMPVKTPVPAGDEITLELPYQVPSALPRYPFPMQLVATVHYKDERGSYSSALVNTTVTFVAKEEAFDALQWLPSTATLGCLALFFYLLLEASPSLKAKLAEVTQDEGAAPSAAGSSAGSGSSSSSSSSGGSSSGGGSTAPAAASATTAALREAGYRAKLVKLLGSLEGGQSAAARGERADAILNSLSTKEIPESGDMDSLVYPALIASYDAARVKAAIKNEGLMKATAVELLF